MFFNRFWLAAIAALLVFGMVAGQPALALVALLVLLTVGGARLWSRYALRAVAYERRLGATRLFRGETLVVEFELVNWKLLPLAWIRIEEEVPDRVQPVGRRPTLGDAAGAITLPHLTSLRPYERVTWRAALHCPERGAFAVGPTRLISGDPFGFRTRGGYAAHRDPFIVYPRVVPLPDLGIPPRQLFGERRVPRALLADPLRPVGIRDYRPEDSLRHVHWKATARTQQLQVRVFEPATVTQLAIFLDLDAGGQPWRGLEPAAFEAAIEVAASLAAHAAGEGYAFGLYSNRFMTGAQGPLRVPPGRGAAHLGRALESLARLSPFATVDFPRHLRQEARDLPRGGTIVVVTATLPPALAVALEALRAAGHRLVLVATAPVVPPPVRGLIVHQLAPPSGGPPGAGEAPPDRPAAADDARLVGGRR